jgi:hypothetical protein
MVGDRSPPKGTLPPEPPHRKAGHLNCCRWCSGLIEDNGTKVMGSWDDTMERWTHVGIMAITYSGRLMSSKPRARPKSGPKPTNVLSGARSGTSHPGPDPSGPERDHPVACARFAILDRARLPVIRCLPSSVDQRGHAVSPSGGDPGRVTLWPGHRNPAQPVGRRGDTGHA